MFVGIYVLYYADIFFSPKDGISDRPRKHFHHVDLSEPIWLLSMLRRAKQKCFGALKNPRTITSQENPSQT